MSTLTLAPVPPLLLAVGAPCAARLGVYSVKDYGAAGDGVSDDTGAIQATINAAAADHGIVWFDPGTYLIRSALHLKDVVLAAAPGAATILIGSSFVPGASEPDTVGAISNANYSVAYNDATANSIELYGLTFHHSGSTVSSTLWFANVKRLVIDHCEFLADAPGEVSPIQLYASYKHVWITNNEVRIATGVTSGVCIQARNYCGAAGASSVCEDIHIAHNYIESNASDENVAIFAEDGTIRDVEFSNNTVTHVAGGSTAAKVMAVFGSLGTPTAYTLTENIVISGNNFRFDNLTVALLALGNAGDTGTIRNVSVIANDIVGSVSATGSSAAIWAQSTVTSLAVRGNQIYNSGATALSRGIQGCERADGNVIAGAFNVAIAGAVMARDNSIALTNAGIGVYNTNEVLDNRITNVNQGVLVDTSTRCSVKNNWITVGTAGLYCVFGQAGNPNFQIVGNTLETTAGGQTALRILGTAAPRIGLNYWLNGGGTYSSLATANAWTVADQ
jgi:hypothetical protein